MKNVNILLRLQLLLMCLALCSSTYGVSEVYGATFKRSGNHMEEPMIKTILITGATDGIGLETARLLLLQGHLVLLHGRNQEKLDNIAANLSEAGSLETYCADLSSLKDVRNLAQEVKLKHSSLDVLINNAGVLKADKPLTPEGYDVRFIVNTVAPYLLTKELLDIMRADSRVINLSSAAQSSVDLDALGGNKKNLDHMEAYSQSKLAITMWTQAMHISLGEKGPIIIAVNPGSLLGSKMVKEGFGIAGKDLGIGADILVRASLDDKFANASGKYYDNDSKRFAIPHPEVSSEKKCQALVDAIDNIING